jgi:hypothetical protein
MSKHIVSLYEGSTRQLTERLGKREGTDED